MAHPHAARLFEVVVAALKRRDELSPRVGRELARAHKVVGAVAQHAKERHDGAVEVVDRGALVEVRVEAVEHRPRAEERLDVDARRGEVRHEVVSHAPLRAVALDRAARERAGVGRHRAPPLRSSPVRNGAPQNTHAGGVTP